MANETTLLDRTLGRLSRALREAADGARVRLTGQLRPHLPEDDAIRLRRQIDDCLNARGGAVAARAAAADLGHTYLGLAPEGRARFLGILAHEYGVGREALDRAMEKVQAATDESERLAAEARLRATLVPPRLRLMTQFNAVPQGVKFLVDLRADLLPIARREPELRALDSDLRGLLGAWFDVGFLDLSRITWQSPAALLEKLIAYEAVHEIGSWNDLKDRLDSDRRCYAFFHPRMPDEPLIFVEVALVTGMAGNVQAVLDQSAPAQDPKTADTAIFYSISNCQKGLAGVSFGDFLIKRVVDALQRDLPNLKAFATLSPIPGFRAWLEREAADETLLTPAEHNEIAEALGELGPEPVLLRALGTPDWHQNAELAVALEAPLLRLCARYLLQEQSNGHALDRVCHFHLSNGARIERLNWLGDISANGLQQSVSLMVNYRYKLDEIDANHEAYVGQGNVAATGAVRRLLRA